MFKLFEVRDGKFTTLPDIRAKKFKSFIVGSVIVLIIAFLSSLLKIDEKDLWKFYNIVIQHFGLGTDAPRIDNEKEIEARIELEVDRAIREYEELTRGIEPPRIPLPLFLEKDPDESLCYSEECKKLGGEMRLCSPWIDTCKEE